MVSGNTERRRWNEQETVLALFLYFQLPFGKLHGGNPDIQKLAQRIGRTSSSVAMKLCNFASLDPQITETGRKGLVGASKLDRQMYAQFASNWSELVDEGERLWGRQVELGGVETMDSAFHQQRDTYRHEPYQGTASETQALIKQRLGQGFFRRAVIANYDETCCITGIAEPRLLVASHIKPWAVDEGNRHNPANGLLLSATMDKAFDQGLMTVTPAGQVQVSQKLLGHSSEPTRTYFSAANGRIIQPASRFKADPEFLRWHNDHCFEKIGLQ